MLGIRLWTVNTYLAAKYILKINYKIAGSLPDPNKPVILASKHQSAWETMFFPAKIHNVVFVLKKELKWFPYLALFVDRAGYIPIDRKKGIKEIKKIVAGTRKAINDGSTVVIFPEGTRKLYGAETDYKPGVAMLYANLPDVDIIPVSLDSGRLWPRNSIAKKRGTVHVTFHPPIEKGLTKTEFMKRLEETIEGKSGA